MGQHESEVTCPSCHGDGNGRGIEDGMGCGYCHGRGTVSKETADAMWAARKRQIARGHG